MFNLKGNFNYIYLIGITLSMEMDIYI